MPLVLISPHKPWLSRGVIHIFGIIEWVRLGWDFNGNIYNHICMYDEYIYMSTFYVYCLFILVCLFIIYIKYVHKWMCM